MPTRADVSLWHRIGTVAAALLNYGLARYAFEQVGLRAHPSASTASVWPGRLFVCQLSALALSPSSTKSPFPAPFEATFHPHLHMNARLKRLPRSPKVVRRILSAGSKKGCIFTNLRA